MGAKEEGGEIRNQATDLRNKVQAVPNQSGISRRGDLCYEGCLMTVQVLAGREAVKLSVLSWTKI